MKILLSGDSHGDINHLKAMQAKVEKFDCDLAFVLGDFGFWPRHKDGVKFLNACSKLDFPVYFLDGNHEDHEVLDKHLEDDLWKEDFIEVHPNVFWAHRRMRWQWDSMTFAAMGGAFSIDRNLRTKYVDWFPREMISEDDVIFQTTLGNPQYRTVDVMLTHDVPSFVDIALPLYQEFDGLPILDKDTTHNRMQLTKIVNYLNPELIFHGHWHVGYTQKTDNLMVQGLNCNRTRDWWTILDTEAPE